MTILKNKINDSTQVVPKTTLNVQNDVQLKGLDNVGIIPFLKIKTQINWIKNIHQLKLKFCYEIVEVDP
jgi:hypothetical protein